ncbi:MAG: kelch repeat-containing protein [Myxococcaceae bacterium]
MRFGLLVFSLLIPVVARADMSKLVPGASPGLRRSTGIATEHFPSSSDDRFWIFGGYISQGNGSEVSETWNYSTVSNTWVQVTPTATPQGARERHGLGWEPIQNRLVLFGGMRKPNQFSVTYFNDVYGYDPVANVWELYTASGTPPTNRIDVSMVWAPDRSAFIVFGGSQDALGTGGARFNNLFELKVNATAKTATWTPLTPTGTPPSNRGAACAGYDTVRNRLILFGGEVSNATMIADVYEWDSATNAWSQPTNVTNMPTARGFAACIWEPGVNRLLLYGGENGNPLAGGAAYDPVNAQWTTLNFATNAGPHTDALGTYSEFYVGMIFFGGRTAASTYTNETWLTQLIGATPAANAGPDQTQPEGKTVLLDGLGSTDPYGLTLTYQWTQQSGPIVSLSGANTAGASFTAPQVSATTQLNFNLQVSNGSAVSNDTVSISVIDTGVMTGSDGGSDGGFIGIDGGSGDGGLSSDGGSGQDAGASDAGELDGGGADAGELDGGSADAGEVDGGDAGEVDAGASDGGADDGGTADGGGVDGGADDPPVAGRYSVSCSCDLVSVNPLVAIALVAAARFRKRRSATG